MSDVIVVEGLCKQFRHLRPDRPLTFQEACLGALQRKAPGGFFWALKRTSDSASRRETMVGIVGQNGAGKSTLLRLLCGVGRPDFPAASRSAAASGALLDMGGGLPRRT